MTDVNTQDLLRLPLNQAARSTGGLDPDGQDIEGALASRRLPALSDQEPGEFRIGPVPDAQILPPRILDQLVVPYVGARSSGTVRREQGHHRPDRTSVRGQAKMASDGLLLLL